MRAGPRRRRPANITVGQLELTGAPTDKWWGTIPAATAAHARARRATDVGFLRRADSCPRRVHRCCVGRRRECRARRPRTSRSSAASRSSASWRSKSPTPGRRAISALLDAALADLARQPGRARRVATSSARARDSIPRPTNPDPGAGLATPDNLDTVYRWNAISNAAGQPLGAGGNWGLEASRFPQAWNWNDAIAEKGPSTVRTAILDVGFDTSQPDLQGMTLRHLCLSVVNVNRCTDNPDSQGHGTATAAIVGAPFDRGPPGRDSTGTVGGNPYANVDLVPSVNSLGNTGSFKEFVTTSLLDGHLAPADRKVAGHDAEPAGRQRESRQHDVRDRRPRQEPRDRLGQEVQEQDVRPG